MNFLFGVVPLFWLPYVIFKIIKGDFKAGAILLCLIAPLTWFIILFFIGFLSVKILWLNKLMNFICYSSGGIFGGIFACISVLLNALSKNARDEFYEGLLRYEKD